jgi:membrane fusion protein, multidrug efflux system
MVKLSPRNMISRQILLTLTAVIVVGVTACSNADKADGKPDKASGERGGPNGGKDRPATVSVTSIAPREFVDSIEAIGTARANESVQLTANVTDRIKSIRFADGQFVRKGAVLVELFAQEETADLNQARARLSEAQSQLARVQALVKDGWATQSRLETQIATRDAARAQVASLEARVQDRFVRAPFSGVVGLRTISPGLVATSGTPIAEISDISRIKVDFTVPETRLSLVRPGMAIIAQSGALLGQKFAGKIEAIDPQIDPVTRAVFLRAVVPNPGGKLKPGMLLTVNVEQLRRTALAVPEQAILADGAEKSVFVVNAAQTSVEKISVTIGARQQGFVEITGGAPANTVIVSDGTVKLRDGGKIKIIGDQQAQTAQRAQGAPATP